MVRSKLQSRKGRPLNLQVGNDPLTVVDVVDNPEYVIGYGNDRVIKAIRTLRNDPIGCMYHRGQLGPKDGHGKMLIKAAWEFQKVAERAGPKVKSGGHLEEPVDGGGFRITEPSTNLADWSLPPAMAKRKLANEQLLFYEHRLGQDHYKIIWAILVDKLPVWGLVCRFYPQDVNAARRRYVGTLVRDLLTQLAKAQGLAS